MQLIKKQKVRKFWIFYVYELNFNCYNFIEYLINDIVLSCNIRSFEVKVIINKHFYHDERWKYLHFLEHDE